MSVQQHRRAIPPKTKPEIVVADRNGLIDEVAEHHPA
jgi:hypothetical protein